MHCACTDVFSAFRLFTTECVVTRPLRIAGHRPTRKINVPIMRLRGRHETGVCRAAVVAEKTRDASVNRFNDTITCS